MQNWDYLLEQADIKLNLLLPLIINPNILAYAQLNGTFDYNRTLTPPPGTTTLLQNKPHNRGTWEPHVQ